MQNKTLTIAIVALFAMTAAPSGAATETYSQPYTGSMGYTITAGGEIPPAVGTLGFVWCSSGCNLDEEYCDDIAETGTCTPHDAVNPGDEIDPIGGFSLSATAPYTDAIVTINDDNFDAAGLWACFINPDGADPGTCNVGNSSPGPDGDYFGYGCGSVSANTGGASAFESVVVYIDTVQLDVDTLETCFSSQGAATVIFG